MIVLFDTSTPVARITILHDGQRHDDEWQADRGLAKGLLGWAEACLAQQGMTLKNIEGIGVYRGPGSFTGLRIGITVCNTLADGLDVPIVGVTGEGWQELALGRLQGGENDRIVLPLYDRDANITKPRK